MKKNPVEKKKSEAKAGESGNHVKPEPVKVVSMGDMKSLFNELREVVVWVRGKQVAFQVRTLTPHEVSLVEVVTKAALPPPSPDGQRLDLTDLRWIETRTILERRARALALYLGVPLFAEMMRADGQTPPVPDEVMRNAVLQDKVREYIERWGADALLRVLQHHVLDDGLMQGSPEETARFLA